MSKKVKKVKEKRKAQIERDWTRERDERCIPVVKEIFGIVASMEKVPINNDSMSKQDCYDIYFASQKKIIDILVANNVDIESEFAFIQQCLNEVLSITTTLVSKSLKENYSVVTDAIFDVKEGEPQLLTATRVGKMIEKKEEIRKAIAEIIEK